MISDKDNNLARWAADSENNANTIANWHIDDIAIGKSDIAEINDSVFDDTANLNAIDRLERRFNNFLIENVACNKRIDEITRRDIMEASNVDIPKQGFLITYSIECSWDTDPADKESIIEKLNDAIIDLHLDEIYEILIQDVTPFEGWSEKSLANSDEIA